MHIVDLMEQRKQIENKMVAIVAKMHSTIKEGEDMMMTGYLGRRKDAKIALDALLQQRTRGKQC